MDFVNLVWFYLGAVVGLLITSTISAVALVLVYRAIKKSQDDESGEYDSYTSATR